MAKYSFKSSGKSAQQIVAETVKKTDIPIGIKTPLRIGRKGEGIFAVNTDLEEQVQDNLRNLLLTNHGERLGLYDFGANLRELSADATSIDEFDEAAMGRIRTAVGKYMPYLDLQGFESNYDNEKNKTTGILRITVIYNVPILNLANKALEVVLWFI